MKRVVKTVIMYLILGISLGCTSFVIMCLSFYLGGADAFLEPIFRDFARHSLGAMLVGIASGGTAVIYQFPRPSGFAKILIHLCVGMGVFYPTALYLGWFPFYPDRILFTVAQFLCFCGIFIGIWFCFFMFNRRDARRINERLKELETEYLRET